MGEARRRREAAKVILPTGEMLGTNRPTEQGWKLGSILADMADAGEPIVRLDFPACTPRCKSCAFTHGTVPNGCPETVLDATGCVVEGIPFMCHEHFDEDGEASEFCSGWIFAKESPKADVLREITGGKLPFEMPAQSEAAQAYMKELRCKKRKERA